MRGGGNILVSNNAKLNIGDNFTSLAPNFNIECRENAILSIGNNCWIKTFYMHVLDNARLDIGNNFSAEPGLLLYVCEESSLAIGNDCMFSTGIKFYTNDAHSIFDIDTMKNISATKEIAKNRKIVIGNHVWLGFDVAVLYNTEIGDGSVIGAKSLVKGKIPNNCTAAGIPARIMRRNIAWGRKFTGNILDCGELYINKTNGE